MRLPLGSPPHSRGRQDTSAPIDLGLGITPAFAGKAGSSKVYSSSNRDHPRIRGEGTLPVRDVMFPVGSPPHSRGRLESELDALKSQGITPAFAGKAWNSSESTARTQDHPRIRGEGLGFRFAVFAPPGSPPHSRGRHNEQRDDVDHRGITPAFAGKAFDQLNRIAIQGDHPRIRGEGPIFVHPTGFHEGSPPHSRGRR